MKQTILLGLLLVVSVRTYSQTITIKDKVDGTPLSQVTLQSENPRAFAITNAEGQADISLFEGAETIQIRRLGYATVTRSFAELRAASFELSLLPTSIPIDEVVVSATRRQQLSSRVPAKITRVTPEEVALQNPQTAADLLGLSGEVYIQKSQQGGGSPMIRGFSTNRLLYSVDGVRMNTAIFRGGNLQNVISLDPFAIESTEVLFGPGSVIYGSDAIGGVMSFQTLTPRFSITGEPSTSGKAVARYASANQEKTGHFDVNVGWKKWALITSVSGNDYGDLRQGSHGPDDYVKPYYVQRQDGVDRVITQADPLLQIPSAYSQTNLMQKLRFMPGDNWDIQYGFHYSETSDYGRYDRHNRVRNGQPRYAEWRYGPQKWMMNNLSVDYRGHTTFYDQVTLHLAQQGFEESRIDRSLNSDTRSIRTEEVDAYSANLDFVKFAGDRHTLYYGAEFVVNDVTSTGTDEDIVTGIRAPGPARYPEATWQSAALYLSSQFQFSEQVTLQAGLRYNRFIIDASFDPTFYELPFSEAHLDNGALTGSLGVSYRPSPSWVFRANASTGFRSPNVDDIGKVFDSEPGSVVVPNPDLEAEYAYNGELGVARSFGDLVTLNLTGYYTRLQNALVRRDFTLNGQDSIVYDGVLSQVQAIQNAAVATRYGLQGGVEIKLRSGFRFSTHINYQDGEDELDDGSVSPPRHAAPLFGISRLSYDYRDLSLQFYTVYQGKRTHKNLSVEERNKTEIYALDENGNTYVPAWYTLNLKARYRFTEKLSVSAGLENITDQRYRPYSSGISGPGRNFLLALRADF